MAQQLTIPPADDPATAKDDAGKKTNPAEPVQEKTGTKREVRYFHPIPADPKPSGPTDPLRTDPLREAPLRAAPLQSDSLAGAHSQSATTNDFSITIATNLLARFVNDERINSKPVATQVMEASVSGMQTTTTKVKLNSVEAAERAELQILTEGTVSSSTVGVTTQATVNTLGSHTFQVTKPVYFDGRQFLTKQAFGSLQARQFPQAVNTSVARSFPLFGQIGNRIAWNEVQRRMPMSDAIVVRRVADDVLPTVNKSVDEKLVTLNRSLSDVKQQLDQWKLAQNLQWSASSHDNSISIAASDSTLQSRNLRTPELSNQLRPGEVCCVLFDERAVNHWLSQQSFEGLEVSDADLKHLITSIPQLAKQPSQLIDSLRKNGGFGKEAMLFRARLSNQRPVQVHYQDGHFVVAVQFQLIPKMGEPGIVQKVTVHLQGESAADDRWAIAIRKVDAEPAEPGVEPDMWTNLIRTQSSTMLKNRKPSSISRVLKTSAWDSRFPDLKLDRIQAIDGILRIAFAAEDRSSSL